MALWKLRIQISISKGIEDQESQITGDCLYTAPYGPYSTAQHLELINLIKLNMHCKPTSEIVQHVNKAAQNFDNNIQYINDHSE